MNQYDEDEVGANEVELPTVFTGDEFVPEEEIDYQSSEIQQSFVPEVQIPDVVRNFIVYFHRNLTERSVWELHAIYENGFNKLTEKFYPKAPWPDAESIGSLVNDDPVFLILYKELYYRHIYAKLNPTLEDRFASYANYCDLFNFILNNSSEPTDLELPNQWLWDIIDEFIYQFQSFCQYRSKVKSKSDDDLEQLKERPDVWNVHNVLNVLYSLIQKSRINEQLLVSKNGGDMLEAAGEFGSRPLYRMLGYFSIIGLLRVHCLLGDYVLALRTMENVELNKKVAELACHVTTYYYVGFAYMMMRRYSDAIKAFAHILLFVSRTKQYHTRSYQYEVISKKSEQMYALLSMSVALSPQRIDENVHTLMREKYGDQLTKMQRGEEGLAVFEELFNFACPKFISPVPPNYDIAINAAHVPTHHQLKIFLAEVRSQLLVPTIRSFLKLYTTLGVEKLATFLDVPADEVRTQLLVFKHKTRQRRWTAGSVTEGEFGPTSDLDFFLKQDLIYIAESKVGRKVGDWFIRHINKFEDIVANMERRV
ncbi:Eukaryotic translation initiation factor 3 subunit L [Borealophlyctis nickersoniae]|nr:Eukaryotic translation initiation factor 3 subunit L [Borealophlyctis nickersoniae]